MKARQKLISAVCFVVGYAMLATGLFKMLGLTPLHDPFIWIGLFLAGFTIVVTTV